MLWLEWPISTGGCTVNLSLQGQTLVKRVAHGTAFLAVEIFTNILYAMISMMTIVSFFFCAAFLLQFSSSQSVEEKSQLESAVQLGDIELATELIRRGALEDYSGPKNRETIYSKLRIAKILLSNGIAGINTQDNDLKINTSNKGTFDVVLIPGSRLITRMVVNVTAVKNWEKTTIQDGKKPIHIITSLPDVSPGIVQIILENGNDDVNSKTDSELTPLMFAASTGNLEVVKYLVERGAKVNHMASFTLEDDELDGHFAFSKLFFKKELNVKKLHFWYSALVATIVGNNADILSYLISKGADVNNKEQSWLVLFHAVYYGRIEMVEILLRSGIDVNIKDVMGSTALHKAAESGRIEMTKILLKNGARLNATDALGWMPIHVASFFSRTARKEMIQFLVQSGSSVKCVTDGGYTPLNLVEAGHNRDFLDFLVKNFDYLNQTKHYKNLTEVKTNEMHIDIVDSLIQLGAPLNHQDNIFGWSTLHWAAASGDLDIVKLLVKNGALINVTSNMDCIPFETAAYFGRMKVAEFLKTTKDSVQF